MGGIIPMTEQKKRYKAVIANQSYTIIGRESKQHMDMVTKLVNDQLREIMDLSSQVDKEQAAILLAVNAISDQLKKQEQLLSLQNKVEELRSQAIKATELENRIKRIEAIESEARKVLDETGRGDVEIHNHVEAQQILNEQRKRKIQEKVAHG
jgi:cell division protein ZapA